MSLLHFCSLKSHRVVQASNSFDICRRGINASGTFNLQLPFQINQVDVVISYRTPFPCRPILSKCLS
jgi:hypothetical protein